MAPTGVPSACLLDVYDTLVTTDFVAVAEELSGLAGIGREQFREAAIAAFPAVNCGDRSLAEAFALIIEACGGEPRPEVVAAMVRRDLELAIAASHLFDDVVPFLVRMRAAGVPTALVSNCGENTRPVLDHLGLSARVDAMVLSCEVRCGKPDPGIYRTALDLLDVAPDQALFVDDQPAYCEGAVALGIRAVRIHRDGSAPSASGAVPVVRSLTEVHAMLGTVPD